MEPRLNIDGLFRDEEELRSVVRKRRLCYDTEPYYIPNRKGELVQVGFELNLYGTFPDPTDEAGPDDREFGAVLRDVRKVALALTQTCDPLHMCDMSIEDSTAVSYSPERKMRPDVTIHIPIFDQEHFGHPVDDRIRETVSLAGRILEQAGVKKRSWTG